MKHCLRAAFVAALAFSWVCWAQSDADQNKGVIRISKLATVLYPPLARTAQISGDVKLDVKLTDGHVESVTVIEGHPFFTQAALESARKSQFACSDCGGRATSFSLHYRFQLLEEDITSCDELRSEPPPPPPVKIDSSSDLITVTVVSVQGLLKVDCPSPPPSYMTFHAAKCLYLWKCGRRRIGLE